MGFGTIMMGVNDPFRKWNFDLVTASCTKKIRGLTRKCSFSDISLSINCCYFFILLFAIHSKQQLLSKAISQFYKYGMVLLQKCLSFVLGEVCHYGEIKGRRFAEERIDGKSSRRVKELCLLFCRINLLSIFKQI